jgi:hypothetical protein
MACCIELLYMTPFFGYFILINCQNKHNIHYKKFIHLEQWSNKFSTGILFFYFLVLFFCNFVCCHISDHRQGDLAIFGYRPAMKVEIY